MIEYITYKGEKYPLRISYSVLKHLKLEMGKDISELASSNDLEYLEVILWYALLSGAEATGTELKLTRDKIEFIFDESLAEFNDILVRSFAPGSSDPTTDVVKKK